MQTTPAAPFSGERVTLQPYKVLRAANKRHQQLEFYLSRHQDRRGKSGRRALCPPNCELAL